MYLHNLVVKIMCSFMIPFRVIRRYVRLLGYCYSLDLECPPKSHALKDWLPVQKWKLSQVKPVGGSGFLGVCVLGKYILSLAPFSVSLSLCFMVSIRWAPSLYHMPASMICLIKGPKWWGQVLMDWKPWANINLFSFKFVFSGTLSQGRKAN